MLTKSLEMNNDAPTLQEIIEITHHELASPQKEDPIRECGRAALALLPADPELGLKLAYQKLHDVPYKEVKTCWRRLYTDASLWKVLKWVDGRRSEQNQCKVQSDWIDEVVRLLDMALILAGAPAREELVELWFAALEAVVGPAPEAQVAILERPPKRQKFSPSCSSVHIPSTFPTELPDPAPMLRYPLQRIKELSLAAFQKKVGSIETHTPCIIEGAIQHWPALAERPWNNPEYLLRQTLGGRRLIPVELGKSYTDEGWGQSIITFREFMQTYMLLDGYEDIPVEKYGCEIANANTTNTNGESQLAQDKSAKSIGYLAQHDLFAQIPSLRLDISIPDYCYSEPIPSPHLTHIKPVGKLEEPLLNAWFGPAGTISPLHTDPYHNILAQVVGYKYVRLYAPEETKRLYPRNVDESGVDMSNTSQVDLDKAMALFPAISCLQNMEIGGFKMDPDTPEEPTKSEFQDQFPDFENAPYVEGILGPGECLYLPVGWWHYVRSLTPSFSGGTSYTAVPGTNFDGRMSLDDIPLATRFQSHSDDEHKSARKSNSDGNDDSDDEPNPRATKRISDGHIPFTGDHEGTGDLNGAHPVQWRISLYTPIAMVSLFISGMLVAVGHHLFYLRFNETPVRGPKEDGASEYISQVWIIRYGTAFAFVAKTLLAGSIVIAYKQHMWTNLRHKTNSVSTIDAVFAATHDFLAFLSPTFWTKAKIPALLALIAWCLPLAALVTPSTLTVREAKQVDFRPTLVPALNLNNTALYTTAGVSEGTSPLLHRITVATATGMEILPMRRVLRINATYEYEFDGPSLKCEKATGDRLRNMAAVEEETIEQLKKASDRKSLEGDLRYISFTSDETGVSTDNLTTYVTDCVARESFRSCGTDSLIPTLWIRMGNDSITCTTYNTRFKAQFGAMGAVDIQPISNVRYEWQEPLNTNVTRSIFTALSSVLNGFFGTFASDDVQDGRFSGKTMIADTALLELLQQSFPALRAVVPQETWMKTRSTQSLAQTIEELSRNQTMSLFSNEALWLRSKDDAATVYARYESAHNEYEYLPYNLWLAYGIAIACSFFAVLTGLRALWLNGVSHDNSFSAIMAVTRNKYLDRLTRGHSLGAAPMGEEILRARLKFGVLERTSDSTGVCRAGFGTEDTVGRLRKGQTVY